MPHKQGFGATRRFGTTGLYNQAPRLPICGRIGAVAKGWIIKFVPQAYKNAHKRGFANVIDQTINLRRPRAIGHGTTSVAAVQPEAELQARRCRTAAAAAAVGGGGGGGRNQFGQSVGKFHSTAIVRGRIEATERFQIGIRHECRGPNGGSAGHGRAGVGGGVGGRRYHPSVQRGIVGRF